MSIDSLIDDKKDALASSGRPLNQGVGPDLIEVLATRKLLEEKAMAARDMALKQQNIPNTIAEQQDQKLLGLTQKEVANQTGGIMQQRAQQQQRPQQRPQQGGIMGARPPMPQGARPPMGGAPKPPMGGAPRPPMPQGARPPMGGAPRPPMMASGGIVGYDVGGKVKSAQEAIRALGNTTDKASPEYQAKLQKILDTLSTQAASEEVKAVTKVLVDAGLKTGPVDKVRSGAYAPEGYVFPKDRKSPDTSAAGFYGGLFDFSTGLPKDADREEAKQRINRARGSQFGGAGSPASGEQVQRQVDERGGMAIVDQAMMLGGIGAVKQIVANAGKKYGPKVVNYAKQKLAKGKDFARTPASKPKYKMGADGKPVMTAPGQAASPNVGNLTGTGIGIGGLAYGADAVMGGTEPAEGKDIDMGGAGVLRPETDQKSVDQKLIDDTNRDAMAQYGSEDGPTVDDAKTFVSDQYNKEAAGGAPQGGVTIPKPEGFEVTKDAVSSGMGDAFTQKLDDRMNQNPADVAAKEREAASKRYKKDETVSGLQSLLDRDLAEAQRVARDPMEQYRRDKAGIYAARAGAPGRAYQQRTLEKQGREGELIKRELSNFATKTNTEQQLISKIDAEAGKAAQRASEEITASMNTILNMSIADRESFDRLLQMDGQRLIKEAELTVQKEAGISIEKTRKLAAKASNMDAFTNALTAMSAIIDMRKEALEKELLVSGKSDEEKAKARKKLSEELTVQYTGPMDEIFKKMGLALKISDSGESDVELTDEEAAALAQ